MPDVSANISEVPIPVQQKLVDVIELRAKDPQQAEMRDQFLASIRIPTNARIVDIGCGPGILARAIAEFPDVREVVGIDMSPKFLRRARELSDGNGKVTFREGDAKALDFRDQSFDVAIMYTVLSHIPQPEDIKLTV